MMALKTRLDCERNGNQGRLRLVVESALSTGGATEYVCASRRNRPDGNEMMLIGPCCHKLAMAQHLKSANQRTPCCGVNGCFAVNGATESKVPSLPIMYKS